MPASSSLQWLETQGHFPDSRQPGRPAQTITGTYLWVLDQATAAERFHRARGGTCVERAVVSPRRRTGPVNGPPGRSGSPVIQAAMERWCFVLTDIEAGQDR